MSKKDIKNAQQPNKNNKETVLNLANLAVAHSVVIELPKEIKMAETNANLIQGYMRIKLNNKKLQLGQTFVALYLGKEFTFTIKQIDHLKMNHDQKNANEEETKQQENSSSFIVGSNTQIIIIDAVEEQKEKKIKQIKMQQFYSFQEQLSDLKQTILQSLFEREELIQNGLNPLKGILVSGFSGSGKTAVLEQIENLVGLEYQQVNWKKISSTEMLSRVVGGAEEFIRNIFAQLKDTQPAVLIIEDIHLLFGAKQVSAHETVLATLMSEMDKIIFEQIVVIASYNSDRDLSKNVRSSGKFEKQIVMNFPNHKVRLQILNGLIGRLKLKEPIDLEGLKKINLRLNGFSIGQIKQILREAYCKYRQQFTMQIFEDILKKYRPTEIKELIVQVPEVYWNQIGGYESVKKQIRKVVELPLQHSAKFTKFGIQPSKGIMLYGPPGCSKTMMAKAIATESKLNFIGIKGPQLFSKYVGQSERAIRNIFKRARACSPCIIFFDEIDSIATQRSANTEVSDRVLCQLLNEMDGIQGLKQIAIVAATNRPQILDKALMRPGRFDYLIYVSPPDEIARKQIFKIYLSKSSQKQKVEELSSLMAKKTQLYTGAQISLICRESVLIALDEDIDCNFIGLKHLELTLSKIRNRLTKQNISQYEKFSSNLKN